MTVKRSFLKAYEIAAKHAEGKAAPPQIWAKDAKNSDVGELWVYEVIGEDWWTGGGVTAKKVSEALASLKGVKTLNIFINSPGGDVFEAKAILSLLQRFDADKVVHVDGIAASAATMIAMAGNRIITAAHANWMIHEASALAYGRAQDMRDMADLLDLQNQDLAETYARQTERPVQEMLDLMAAETWMSAQQALDEGFTDEIAEPAPAEEPAAKAEAAGSPLVRAALSTDDRVRSIRQARRLEEISARASPGGSARGQPRPNPAVPRKSP